jgi:phenylalanyl-tRNA synthetase beta chain
LIEDKPVRISREWLEQYIDLSGMTDDALCAALTGIGLEVEHVERVSSVAGVVTGRIVQAVQHPNADSLRLCQVDVGSAGNGANLQIVCGAPNAREGIYVAVAMVGAELPGNFKIKEAKIRGEKSFGMMCSEKELGISDNHESIIELKETPALHTPLGTPLGTAMGLDDMVMTLNVTPNRADCLSCLGVAPGPVGEDPPRGKISVAACGQQETTVGDAAPENRH